MNWKCRRFFLLLLAVLTLAVTSPLKACSIFTLVRGGRVLFGNNEDYIKPGAVWFLPGDKDRFGRINFGFHDENGKMDFFPQGSMNERGLVFDAAVTPSVKWKKDPNKKESKNIVEDVMNRCSTVDEVIKKFEEYNCPFLANCHFVFADATGRSVVIAWLPKKGLCITRMQGEYQVATNTRLKESSYRCQRWVRAEKELSTKGRSEFESVKAALKGVRQCGQGFTSYSCIYDLKARTISLFNLGNFQEMIVFDLKAELKKGKAKYLLKDLFKKTPTLESIKSMKPRGDYGTAIKVSAEKLKKFAGQYQYKARKIKTIEVLWKPTGLEVKLPTGQHYRTIAESEKSFRFVPDQGSLKFQVEDGKVKSLILSRRKDTKATRADDSLKDPGGKEMPGKDQVYSNGTIEKEVIKEIEDALDDEIEKQNIVGIAIGVIKDSKVAYLRANGLADREKKVAATTKTVFNWASNSKPMVAVAAMKLAEQGKLDLDKDIRHYLPTFPEKSAVITARDLLCHQSGMPHYRNGVIKTVEGRPVQKSKEDDPEIAVNRFAGSKLIFKPGEKQSYSSYAYVLLSAVVQKAAGQPLSKWLDNHIIQPKKLTSFQMDVRLSNQENWATGYRKGLLGRVVKSPEQAHFWKHGAGGYKSNIRDFAKWGIALMDHSLLNHKSEQRMWKRQKGTTEKRRVTG